MQKWKVLINIGITCRRVTHCWSAGVFLTRFQAFSLNS